MEFQCPKCKYPLTGTPDVCPLCHTPLRYTVETNDGSAISSMGIGMNNGVEGVDTGLASADLSGIRSETSETADPKKDKGKILAFNIAAIIFNVFSIAFFLFLLLMPMFLCTNNTIDHLNTNFYDPAHFIEPPQSFGYLNYITTAFTVIFQNSSGEPSYRTILFYFLHFPVLILGFIGFALAVASLVVNIINLIKKKLPTYVAESIPEDMIGDPLNPLGHIISISIFLLGAIYIPYVLEMIPLNIDLLKSFDNLLYYSMTPIVFFYLVGMIAVIIAAIVKRAIRSLVNPMK